MLTSLSDPQLPPLPCPPTYPQGPYILPLSSHSSLPKKFHNIDRSQVLIIYPSGHISVENKVDLHAALAVTEREVKKMKREIDEDNFRASILKRVVVGRRSLKTQALPAGNEDADEADKEEDIPASYLVELKDEPERFREIRVVQGWAIRWCYLPWTEEMRDSCKPIVLRLKFNWGRKKGEDNEGDVEMEGID
ncbi:hypothetical protein GQ43DRAFT_465200 [Delitschia confertaspora ATCC 74209]|uniref:Uncharacterized protein n=1 Tax=Delitschia confertaspora ATCC 74209 TaxID=1513339 RepID=A0A9P4JGF1_9PLEO|nr:hypothetical protein GQ43DRAFT_465200 [Delitschia confertaspora ATCC 74209]